MGSKGGYRENGEYGEYGDGENEEYGDYDGHWKCGSSILGISFFWKFREGMF